MAKTTRGAKTAKGGAGTPQSVIQMAKEKGTQFVDFKFVDLPGIWQHFAIPINELTEEVFSEGLGFDGSSIRGWKAINESDMLVLPDPASAFMDPFFALPTLSLTCSIQDPITREDYNRDPRSLAARAVEYLKSTGIADTAYFGPEAEFFVFDDVRFDQNSHEGYYHLDSVEGRWNSGRQENPNLGYKIPYKGGYFPVAPADTQADLRAEMSATMINCGISIERDHHEVATAGQAEIDIRFCPMLTCADQMMLYKYIVRNVARRHGQTATFMPKPLFQDNGSGMHTHQSLWKGGKPLFAGSGYAGLSEMALYYIGGLLKHAPAILALSNPTTNSYRRLVPGYEAPVNLAYSQRNRSAAIRIPMYSPSPKAKRVEFRCPDASCNMYLAFAAMLMAGLDGIQNKIDPGKPLDKNIYDLAPEEAAKVPHTPGSLEGALSALEKDNAFLLRGNVFSSDLIGTWINYKRENEVDAVRLRPHPYEFMLYYDV
ncbi:MAG: type I glutamate--ammonia ligase [Candidatus Latescibacteria bacterium]|nr:type I glutamate--ammonia ligase [Candidatus Latescibacterota bacterium]